MHMYIIMIVILLRQFIPNELLSVSKDNHDSSSYYSVHNLYLMMIMILLLHYTYTFVSNDYFDLASVQGC